MASRKEPLFLRQPREGLPGLLPGQLMLVVRGIFGLANSPRLFWRHLRDTLLRMGFIQSTLDRALFMYYKGDKLVLVLGAHVDDLIGTGAPGDGGADGILKQLKEAFGFRFMGRQQDRRSPRIWREADHSTRSSGKAHTEKVRAGSYAVECAQVARSYAQRRVDAQGAYRTTLSWWLLALADWTDTS